MPHKIIPYYIVASFVLLLSTGAAAQKTAAYTDPDYKYKSAYGLFIKEKYSAAAREFQEYLAAAPAHELNRTNAEYFYALASAELFHPDAEKLLTAFIEHHPENAYAKIAGFEAAKVYYRQKKYKDAIEWFEKTDVTALTNEQIAEYYFKSGYSYYVRKDVQKASSSFHKILNTESKYKTAALYYYAHTAYANGNYSTALENFQKLKDSETFGQLVPYYIMQIYFQQGRHDELIEYATTLETLPAAQAADMQRLIAESYYRKNRCAEALKYFDEYAKAGARLTREDYYQVGYCNYTLGAYENAIAAFEKTINGKDSIAQNAYYHLADCFLKTDNKERARSAFQSAAKLGFDKNITEDASFNFAKLSYQLNYQPAAINLFRDYIKQYPESNTDEANEMLAQLYITTRNYKDALASLENIAQRNPRAKNAYQKVAFYRGTEFYNDGDMEKAIALFNKAITNAADPLIAAQAMYWKAEALYSRGNYAEAIKEYRIFIFNPSSVNLPGYAAAGYGLAYSHFKEENYDEAILWFRKYIKENAPAGNDRYNDALIRTADAFFMQKNYLNAAHYYDEAIAGNAKAADYSLFQKGMIHGISGNMRDKAAAMEQVAAKHPKSAYLDDATFERGAALLALNENREAEEQFKKITGSFAQSNYVKKAKLNLALIYYNDKKDDKAMELFRQVITNYPSTPEAAEALTAVKNIYVNSGNPTGYFDYLKTVPYASISAGAQDSITYEAAEQQYMKGETAGAARDFENYLSRFPDGAYALNAAFYKAESDYKDKNFEKALIGYERVIDKPKNIFTEKSLLKAAGINYMLKNYEKASEQYHALEEQADFKDNIIAALAGQMRSNFNLKKFESAVLYAQKLIAEDKASAAQINEAHLIYGKSALEKSDLAVAANEFKALSKITNSAIGAEARYHLALIAWLQNNYKESQKLCFEVINKMPSYDYWVAESFILLADNYLALKDTFQAKHTLKSIIENYNKSEDDPEDLKAKAQEKYDRISASENELRDQEPAASETMPEEVDLRKEP